MTVRRCIDPDAWQSVLDLAPEGEQAAFVTELVGMLAELAPELISAMRADLARGDAAGLRYHAHKLKGCSVNLGASRLAELCQELESEAAAGRLPADPSVLAALESLYGETSRELAELCAAA